jgi:hypothetical protein
MTSIREVCLNRRLVVPRDSDLDVVVLPCHLVAVQVERLATADAPRHGKTRHGPYHCQQVVM